MVIQEFSGPYRFLSNFAPAEVTLAGIDYPSVEHAFQAAKTLSGAERQHVRAALTAAEAKKRGRAVTLRSDWETIKVPVMRMLLQQKFGRYGAFREKLLATGNAQLVEGNKWGDLFWGVDITTHRGENHLGRLLMEIRQELSWQYERL